MDGFIGFTNYTETNNIVVNNGTAPIKLAETINDVPQWFIVEKMPVKLIASVQVETGVTYKIPYGRIRPPSYSLSGILSQRLDDDIRDLFICAPGDLVGIVNDYKNLLSDAEKASLIVSYNSIISMDANDEN